MHGPGNPLEDLQDAWRRLDAAFPETDPAGKDPDTRAAVALLQRAWARLEAPPAPVLRRRRRPVAARWAAGLLLLLLPALALLLARRQPRPAPLPVAGQEQVAAARPELEVLDNRTPGRLVLRSGSVRLTLLQPTTRTDTTP